MRAIFFRSELDYLPILDRCWTDIGPITTRSQQESTQIKLWILECLFDQRNDLGVIMPAAEVLCAGTDSEDRHDVRGVCASGPTDMRFLIEQCDTCAAERIDSLIHRLGIFALACARVFI